MIRPRTSLRTRTFIAAASVLAAGTLGWALNEKNAGPAQFEIKFKLPVPKPLTPAEELKTFRLPKGFHAELVAAEPMVEEPIAMSWDENGRLFVCEMRGYMQDVEGKGEELPLGRIVVLEDADGDGKMDKRTVFADKLTLPRAVTCVNGGVLVAEPPVLWFLKDTNGDGVADVKEQVDGAFGVRGGQPEHMANSPTRFLDNWIYSANHGTRYKLKDGKWIAEGTPSRGQWGMTQDDFGRPFYNFNSDFLRANFVPETLYRRNPNFAGSAGAGVQILKDQTCWPSHPTPGVNRGYDAKALREDGTLAKCTATCGAAIYRGGLFPKEFAGNAFIPEPSANLLKRVIIEEKDAQLTARNAYGDKVEFMTSTDERFRPVNASTGPDGALYIADMYRGVIQHRGFLTHYLIANIKDRKLEQPFNMGRIWRIVPDGAKPQTVKLPAEPAKIVDFLAHKNGTVRDTAQRVLVEKKDAATAPAIAKVATTNANPLAKIHALWTLEGMAALTPDVITACLADKDAKVRAAAVRVSDRTMSAELAKLVNDPSADVQVALAFTLSGFPEAQDAAIALGRRSGANALVREALVSGLRGRELEVLESMVAASSKPAPEFLNALAQAVMNERRSARVKKLLALIVAQPANGPLQIAMLEGAAGKNAPKGSPKVKLLYLDSEAPELAAIAKSADAKAKPLLAAVDARVAWPAKPGVPPPPVIVPLTADQQKLYDGGKTVYNMLCTACHQPTGTGMDGLAPALVDSEWVLGSADILPRIIIHGLSGPIKVNGQSWNLEMPPLGAALNDEQVAGVVTYIRREWEHNGSPISIADVAKIREQNKTRTKAWIEAELKPPAPKKPGADKSKPATKPVKN